MRPQLLFIMGHAFCSKSIVVFVLCFASFSTGRLAIQNADRVDAFGRLNGSVFDLFDCLANVTRTYFDRRTIYVYFDESRGAADYTATVDAFSRAVQSPKVIMPYSSLTAEDEQQPTRGAFAFLVEDGLYARLLDSAQQSHFVAVWTRPATKSDIRRVFRDFWGRGQHVNVIGLVATDDDATTAVKVYTYRPFTSYGCGKLGRPLLLDRWWDGRFRNGVNLFSHVPKTGDMHGCSLTCVGNEQPPDVVLRRDYRGRWTASGVGGEVLRIVARHMNFTPVITSPKGDATEMYSWYNNADVLHNITAMLHAGEADLAFGWYSYATHDNEYNTRLAKSTSIDCLGWAVPYRAGQPPRSWTNYVNEFDRFGWLCIGSMFVVVVGVFHYFRRLGMLNRVSSAMFFVYQTIMDQPVHVQPVRCSIRVFMIHWLWYCMVISVAYKASLGSFMTVPPHGAEFTRMDQILDSDLVTVATPRSMQIMNVTSATTRISRTFMRRLRTLPPGDFGRVIDRLVARRDIAVFEVKRFMYYFSKPQARRIKVKIPIRFLPGCLLRTHTTQFMFGGGSYLTESVNEVLSTLFETGIVDHWIEHLGSNKVLPLEKIRGRVLKLVRLKEAFLFLFSSYAVAAAVLLGEICLSRRLRRHTAQPATAASPRCRQLSVRGAVLPFLP